MMAACSVYPASFRLSGAVQAPGGNGSGKIFLTEDHPQFQACVETSYRGFVREKAGDLPAQLHRGFRDAVRSVMQQLPPPQLFCAALLARHALSADPTRTHGNHFLAAGCAR